MKRIDRIKEKEETLIAWIHNYAYYKSRYYIEDNCEMYEGKDIIGVHSDQALTIKEQLLDTLIDDIESKTYIKEEDRIYWEKRYARRERLKQKAKDLLRNNKK